MVDDEPLSRLYHLVDSGLVGLEQVRAWADGLLVNQEEPEPWLCELAMAAANDEALALIATTLQRPLDSFEGGDLYHLACLYLRHRAGGLSWPRFLHEAGVYSDAADMVPSCGFFYDLLEESGSANSSAQVQEVEGTLGDWVAKVEEDLRDWSFRTSRT